MTTFTDKELIKEIKERIGSLDVRDNIERRAYEIALASLEAEAVMFCISGQNVDSEEHVSTSKAVVDAWVEEWNQVDGSPGEPLYKTMPLYLKWSTKTGHRVRVFPVSIFRFVWG